MNKLKIPKKVYIVRPHLTVQAAESHISKGLMDGFLELNINCKIIEGLQFLPEKNKNILIIDDLANYKSDFDINNALNLSKKGNVIALWVHWPILKESKYFNFHNKLITKHLEAFKILYGEREPLSMITFEKLTNRKYYKIPNASPSLPEIKSFKEVYENKNNYDVVFIGSKMKSKSFIFKKVLPLLKKDNPKIRIGLFGRGFNKRVRFANGIIKLSNKYIAPFSSGLNKFINNKMVKINQVISSEKELSIYRNSKICINYHEDTPQHIIYNLRYFKIPFYGGFQLVDSPIKDSPYFNNDEVIHIESKDEKEWVEKINYYLDNPLERYKIQLNGNKKAIKYHSYKERSKVFLNIYNEIIGNN